MVVAIFLTLQNLTPDPSPAERGAVCPRLAPLSAGEGSGVRFIDGTFSKKEIAIQLILKL
jgi:hypothetical protein